METRAPRGFIGHQRSIHIVLGSERSYDGGGVEEAYPRSTHIVYTRSNLCVNHMVGQFRTKGKR
ncbi:hypothetical protein DPMN_180644 [Dreissena polymorpha]|uniref:Uncharacterized protein n=1 Tax=Dreissena polymorpha TaxID=45954 RepID=A0A9D4ILU2_DREPO|nr:hypothetical protein DPMN_180644 [Dreissena polymorpha]